MYVNATLKAPETEPWVALTRVDSDGSTRSLGYLAPETFVLCAETLRKLHAVVESDGWPSADEVGAWEDFVYWVDVIAELRP